MENMDRLEMEGKNSEKAKPEDAAQEADVKQKEAAKQTGPPENRIDISIVWINGRVAVKAPANPIMVMKVIGQALDAISNEYLEIARKAQAQKMFEPGPEVGFVPDPNTQKVVDAVEKQIIGG
jgi:hypothetical protein